MPNTVGGNKRQILANNKIKGDLKIQMLDVDKNKADICPSTLKSKGEMDADVLVPKLLPKLILD
jgi:hypothetical protein